MEEAKRYQCYPGCPIIAENGNTIYLIYEPWCSENARIIAEELEREGKSVTMLPRIAEEDELVEGILRECTWR